MAASPAPDLQARLEKIRCLLLDVDGVLTDGRILIAGDGQEFKSFHILDGHGIVLARRAGLTVGIVSGRPSEATTRRAAQLGVTLVVQRPVNKMELVEEIKNQHGFADDQIAFVGDDLPDLPVLRRVGLAVAVPNGVEEVQAAAHYVTNRAGGHGAVREVIDLLLKAQGMWDQVSA